MKIAMADNQSLKFDIDLKQYWEKRHDLRYEIGANPKLVDWCDVYYVNCWDHNIHAIYTWQRDGITKKKPKIICRALDWEVWIGLARSEEMGAWVDHIIAIAPHIKRKLEAENSAMAGRVHLIRPGVNLDRFTMKKEFGGYNIIIPCNEVDWYLKHVIEGVKIFKMLTERSDKPWKLFVKGHFKEPEIFQMVIKDYIEKTGIKDRVQFDEQHVPDYNEYLEQMDYCLQPSLKEAFSFTVAECMAKGIKPVLNNWIGCEEIWPDGFIYDTPDKAVQMLLEQPKPGYYRRYIRENNSLERMFKQYDRLLEI